MVTFFPTGSCVVQNRQTARVEVMADKRGQRGAYCVTLMCDHFDWGDMQSQPTCHLHFHDS